MEQKILDEFRVEGRTRARRGKHGGPQARRDGFCTPLEIPEEGFVGHSGNDWDFNRGYQKLDRSCVVVEAPANGYLGWSGGD